MTDKKLPLISASTARAHRASSSPGAAGCASPGRFYGPYVDVGLLAAPWFWSKRVFPCAKGPSPSNAAPPALNFAHRPLCPASARRRLQLRGITAQPCARCDGVPGRSDELQAVAAAPRWKKVANGSISSRAARIRDSGGPRSQLTADQKMTLRWLRCSRGQWSPRRRSRVAGRAVCAR